MRDPAAMQIASRTAVPSLGLELVERRHPSGLVHLHLACADEHRAFCIAFRTPPTDSTGLPHILEHTTLCGSRRYPVRDPFFMMLRRSLATFMNAMTYPDLTAYPFATQVAKDWDNLLGVYLDAVFAPRLDVRDFRQEGHRLAKGPDGAWKRQGVVFNEMQGALGSTDAQVANALARTLLPDTVYAVESGGEPREIPRLTHADLVAFHRRCYRPANALLTTYGDVDLPRLDALLAPYLDDPGQPLAPPHAQPPLPEPRSLGVPVPLGEGQDPEDVTESGIAWCWGDTAAIDEVLAADLVERVLLGHPGAPLRLALESSGLGRGLGSSGYAGHARNGMFTAAIEGHAPGEAARIHALIAATIERIAADGVPQAELDAALHQLELSRREVRGDGWSYGLELALRLVGPWNLGVDPLPFLAPGDALARLKAAADPAWLRREVASRLVANPHRAAFSAKPDPAFHERERAAVAELDRAELAAPGAAERLAAEAAALAERQAAPDDPGVLPDLDLAEVPRGRRWAQGAPAPWAGGELTVFSAPTNGITHLLAALPAPLDDEPELLPMLAAALGGLGCGARTYTEQGALLNACSGGVRAWLETGADPDDPAVLRPWFLVEVKGLSERTGDFLPLLAETLLATRFDEGPRLAELVEQSLAAAQDRVTRAGHGLAAAAAARGLPGAAGLQHRIGGLGRLAWLKREAAADPAALGARLAAARDRLAAAAPRAALIGDRGGASELIAAARWPARPAGSATRQTRPAATAPPVAAFTTGTSVNYCALVFAAPALRHADAAALAVGARILTNRWLHPRLRERGGAYGGGAGYSAGQFQLTSYRDPRLAETYRDMRDGLGWLATAADDAAALKEAQLGVLQGLDAPGSPAGEARRRFLGDLTGRDPATIDAFRARILACTPGEVRAAAARWLPAAGGSAACITAPKQAATLGWETTAI
jgi:Zn-dependent M16 (insulinase) family peptidase